MISAFPYQSLRDEYQRCIEVGRFPFPRANTFTQPSIRHFAKSGSLGRCYFVAEGGVVRDATPRGVVAAFGYCSQGWRLPAFMVETVCGLIGVEIARVLGLAPGLNPDWTAEGAALLLGDLWVG